MALRSPECSVMRLAKSSACSRFSYRLQKGVSLCVYLFLLRTAERTPGALSGPSYSQLQLPCRPRNVRCRVT